MRCQLRNHVGGIISEGIAHGDFDADIDIDMATSSLFTLLNTTSERARGTETRAWESIGEWYARLFLSALLEAAVGRSLLRTRCVRSSRRRRTRR